MLIDSHCHLNFPDFKGKIDETISAANNAGVGVMQTICTSLKEYEEICGISDSYPCVYNSVGVHPHDGDDEQVTAEELIKLSSRTKTIGLGETGLDYYYDNANRENQKKNFIEHIKAAQETGLPVIIHTRDAEDDTYQILSRMIREKPFTALLHCFTGTADLAQKCLDLGFYISISGIITFKNAEDLRNTVKNVIPLDRLMVETDAPFLAPIPHRGKPNQPAYTRITAEYIANLKEIPYEVLAEKTTQNFFNLFTKAKL